MLIVLALAWAYVRFGTLAQVGWLFYGIKPIIIAIVLQALWGLGRKAVKNVATAVVGIGVFVLYLLGVNVLVLLAAGGAVLVAVEGLRHLRNGPPAAAWLPLAFWNIPAFSGVTAYSLPLLFLTFLKIGALLYGSGYVLLAFLHADFVVRLGWLTDQQLVDAIAVGQVTPGPVFTTATFIGYLLGGLPGALLGTLGIFLPSFAFVALVYPVLNRLRNSPWTAAFLDGVIVASLGLMAGVTGQLGLAALVDPFTILLALAAASILFRYKINPPWLILAGALAGVLVKLIR
jgi:chromate transporter